MTTVAIDLPEIHQRAAAAKQRAANAKQTYRNFRFLGSGLTQSESILLDLIEELNASNEEAFTLLAAVTDELAMVER